MNGLNPEEVTELNDKIKSTIDSVVSNTFCLIVYTDRLKKKLLMACPFLKEVKNEKKTANTNIK